MEFILNIPELGKYEESSQEVFHYFIPAPALPAHKAILKSALLSTCNS